MARMIDADALKAKCGEWYTEEGTEEGFIGTLGSLLDAAPTVDAIPVEWLEKMAEQHQSGVFNAYWFVLKTWQKEQEVE